ncbi:MAG: hypothetical protein V4513_00360 [Pseudomonadota bacterium]
MTSEPKPFASLSSGLLARKGAARPAMRPQGFGQAGAALEDLGWNDMGFEPPKPASAPRDATHDAFGEDVVEHPHAHPTGLTPVTSPVHSQQAEIVDRFVAEEGDEEEIDETAEIYDPEAETEAEVEEYEVEAVSEPEPALVLQVKPVRAVKPAVAAVTPTPAPRREPKARSVAGAKGKAAFTLRLDPSRHLKLRLACAVNGRSAQQLVTDALDQLLEHMPELDAMAETAKRKGQE